VNGELLTPERLIEIFLYGRYLHKDLDKAALLEDAPVVILQLEFLSTMQTLSQIYLSVARQVVGPVLASPSLLLTAAAA
jgi:hypothetical protein